MISSKASRLHELYKTKPFEFHANDLAYDCYLQIARSFHPGLELFYASGSFADHYMFCSLLCELSRQYPERDFRVLTNRHYSSLYRSFSLDSKLVTLPDNACHLLSHYYRLSLDWLKSEYAIKPLLGVYYPLLPSMCTQQGSVQALDIISRILQIERTRPLIGQTDIGARADLLDKSERYFGLDKRPRLLFFPTSNTLLDIDSSFWRLVFEGLTSMPISIVVASRGEATIGIDPAILFDIAPEDIVPLAAIATLVVGAGNGAMHTVRMFATTSTFTVIENPNNLYARAKDGRAVFLNSLSADSYPGDYLVDTRLFPFNPIEDIASQARKLISEIIEVARQN